MWMEVSGANLQPVAAGAAQVGFQLCRHVATWLYSVRGVLMRGGEGSRAGCCLCLDTVRSSVMI